MNCVVLTKNFYFNHKWILNKILQHHYSQFSNNSIISISIVFKTQTQRCIADDKNVNRKTITTLSARFKKMFSNSSRKLEEICDSIETIKAKRLLSTTVDDGQHSILLLQDVIRLRNKKISNWVIENNIKNLCSCYKLLQKEHKDTFLRVLATKYAVNHQSVSEACQQISQLEIDSGKMLKMEEKLKAVITPEYSWLFKNIGRLEMGVKFLVDLRTDVMDLLPTLDPKTSDYIAVQQLNIMLRELLTVWFSVGFLKLERVTWKSPCNLLEKIAEYEAVHPIRSWMDLKRRLGHYRRCFVYTHSSMPEEPLVVLHVALTEDIVSSLDGITLPLPKREDVMSVRESRVLDMQQEEDPQLVKAFIFYSVFSTQRGLQGIELGNYLIKGAAITLRSEYPKAMMFSTLSPIPTFRIWLIERIKLAEKGEEVFTAGLWDNVLQYLEHKNGKADWSELRKSIQMNSWYQDPELVSLLKAPLMACCSKYLYHEKRRGYAFDSVANFHLRNGAVMWRLNWLADVSPRGLTNSCGLMVNYRYYLDEAESNSVTYVETQKISASKQIVDLTGGLNSKL